MWPDGSWSSIAEKASPGKEIIHPGWTRRLNAWLRKKSRKPSDRKHWNGNWSGYAWLQKHVMPNPKHVWPITKSWPVRSPGKRKTNWNYSSPPDHAWETKGLLRKMFQRHMAIN